MGKNSKTTPAVDKAVGVNPDQNLSSEQMAAAEKAEADKAAAEKVEADKAAAEKVEADKAAAEKAEADKAAAEKVEADKAAAEKVEADKAAAIETHDAEIIPSGRFIAENGNEYEFAVSQFTFQGKTYSKEEALSDHADVLEHLAKIKSFILKKV
jgi:membrane protein involved in colicin uptake